MNYKTCYHVHFSEIFPNFLRSFLFYTTKQGRDVFWTLSNIYDETFLPKYLTAFNHQLFSQKPTMSLTFDMALNASVKQLLNPALCENGEIINVLAEIIESKVLTRNHKVLLVQKCFYFVLLMKEVLENRILNTTQSLNTMDFYSNSLTCGVSVPW